MPVEGEGRAALLCVCAAGFAFAVNYTNHAPVASTLMRQFHFDRALAGLLTTGIFLSHALMQVPGGHLADRFGPRRVLAAALAWLTLGNFGLALAGSYDQLLFWKIFIGFGTGTCFVAGARYIAGMFEGAALNHAQGLYGGSILLGSGFVIFAVPQFLAAFGWRGAFAATAAVGAASLLAWLGVAPRPRETAAAPAGLAHFLACRELWLLGVIQMASFGLVMVAGSWIAMVFQHDLALAPAPAGLAGSLVLLLGIISRPLGGAVLQRTGIRPLLAASVLGNAAGCWMLAHPSAPTAAAAVTLLGICCGLPYAALFNRAAALFPGRAGAAMGFVNMLGILMILAGAPAVGRLADWTGNFHASFRALALLTLASGAAIAGIQRQRRRGNVDAPRAIQAGG